MNAKQYLEKYGKFEAERVAVLAGTNLAYYKHLVTGFRKPSAKLAYRLHKASSGQMSILALLHIYDE